ncbi:hypothetical protein F5I97DRAFT_1400553 [Phlebopus sp. FC_14]|nr:hypothetical protein F5I97DRAFT_1400553 [Phlebopus sp. FC_14]
MSEQSPPPKPKPGSLRDRIAAFENKNAGAAPGPAPAPVPRPKPGGLQWKPKVPSPPSSPDSGQAVERKVSAIGGMSASDAMESIGRGGTLKERMAALQGKGAFGAASPPPMPPKPAEKPKWKPPPAVVSPPAEEDPKEFLSRDASRSPPLRSVASPSPEIQRSMKPEGDGTDQETEGGEVDPEEEERQRRANIAARMARLGGARVGMGPPVFAPKPVTRKPASPPPAAEVKQEQVPADETKEPEATSLPQDSLSSSSLNDETTAEPEAPAQEDSELVAGDSAAVGPPAHTRAPASMPVPAGPRRAAPPRKKAYKSAPAAPLPEPPNSEAEPETAPAITDKEPVTDVEQLTVSPPAEFFISGDVQKEVGVVGKSVEETYDEHLNIKQEIAERTGVVATEHPLEPVADTHEDIEVEEEHVGVAEPEAEEESTAVADDEQAIVPKAPEVEVEDEDEDARRKRVAAKLAQMGAFNPFAGPPPIPRRESIGESKVNEGLDVEDEVNVDVEEVGETVPSPPVLSPKEVTVGSVKHVDDPHVETKAGEEADGDEQVSAPVDRDGES